MRRPSRSDITLSRLSSHCALLVCENRELHVPSFALFLHFCDVSPYPNLRRRYRYLRPPASPMPNAYLPTTLRDSPTSISDASLVFCNGCNCHFAQWRYSFLRRPASRHRTSLATMRILSLHPRTGSNLRKGRPSTR